MRDVTDHSVLHRRRFLRSSALAAAGALSSSLAACSSGPQSTNDTGGGRGGKDAMLTAVYGYGNDGSWDPTQTASAFAMAANNHIYEGPSDTDPISRQPYAALATEVPVISAARPGSSRCGPAPPSTTEARHRRRRGLRLRPDPRP